MISTGELEIMKPTAVLLNTARGGLVSPPPPSFPQASANRPFPQIDEKALLHALQTHQIYGAGLDVLCSEPATVETYAELFACENVVVLPHAGAGTERVQADSCDVAVLTTYSFLKGEGVGKSRRVV